MMTHRLAQALVDLAARRWPEHLRDEVRREWTAEVAVLAADQREWKMLRYAASLATHPAPRPATPLLPRVWNAARVLVMGPAFCLGLVIASLFATTVIAEPIAALLPSTADWVARSQLPVMSLLCLAFAVVAGRLGRRWALDLPGVLLPVLVATVPGFAAAAAMFAFGTANAGRPIAVIVLYALGFTIVLYGAALLARFGRGRAAWWLAIGGAAVLADLAVMPAIFAIQLAAPEDSAITGAFAPMWLPALLADWGFGLPHPTPAEVFTITDVLVGVPQILMIVTGWALGAVLRAAKPEPAGWSATQPA